MIIQSVGNQPLRERAIEQWRREEEESRREREAREEAMWKTAEVCLEQQVVEILGEDLVIEFVAPAADPDPDAPEGSLVPRVKVEDLYFSNGGTSYLLALWQPCPRCGELTYAGEFDSFYNLGRLLALLERGWTDWMCVKCTLKADPMVQVDVTASEPTEAERLRAVLREFILAGGPSIAKEAS
ncbi:MAG: hypothetical protein M1337_08905 [Actinobacteria bacterium]|nr:hypothetical protein [Actinomycetota bacterium]